MIVEYGKTEKTGVEGSIYLKEMLLNRFLVFYSLRIFQKTKAPSPELDENNVIVALIENVPKLYKLHKY